MYPESFCQAAYVNSLREFISHRHTNKKLLKFIRAIMSIDLAPVDHLLAETYSKFGPRPYAPFSRLIACLLAVFLKVPSITDWVERLRNNVLYARICGWRDCRSVPAIVHDISRAAVAAVHATDAATQAHILPPAAETGQLLQACGYIDVTAYEDDSCYFVSGGRSNT